MQDDINEFGRVARNLSCAIGYDSSKGGIYVLTILCYLLHSLCTDTDDERITHLDITPKQQFLVILINQTSIVIDPLLDISIGSGCIHDSCRAVGYQIEHIKKACELIEADIDLVMVLHGLLAVLMKHLVSLLDTVTHHQHGTDALMVTDKCLDGFHVKVELCHHRLRQQHNKQQQVSTVASHRSTVSFELLQLTLNIVELVVKVN